MDAVQNEAEQAVDIEIVWRGVTLTIPASLDDASIEVMEAFENGKAVGAMRGILGDRQFDRLKTELGLKGRDFADLADTVAKEMGFGSQGK